MIKLSIIIPVYNVEKYVARCLESCLEQDLPMSDYEILVVNDGSKDNSMDIVRQYAQKYDNIRIVEQKNAGLSAARNRGIQEAEGEYLWFVDSDDVIKQNVIKDFLHIAICDSLDALCFDINVIKDGGYECVFPNIKEKSNLVYSGIEFISAIGMPPSGCVALYRKDFLISNSLFFRDSIVHEDQEFTPRAYCLANRIAYVNIPAYNYWVRSDSIMTSPDKRVKKATDLLIICDSLYHFAQRHLKDCPKAYDTMMSKINFAFSQSLRNYTKGVSTISEYKSKPYYPLDISVEGERRVRWKYRLINFSIPLYLLVHRMLKR